MSRARRVGIAAHLPRLAALVFSIAAAAASYTVHVDRSVSSSREPGELARPTAHAEHRHPGSRAHHKKPRHHRTRKAHQQRPRTATQTVVVTRVVPPRCDPPRPASRARPPDEQPASARADTETERAVDRELQEVINQEIPARAQP